MRTLMLLALLGLGACGVDGEPVQPTGGVNVVLSDAGVQLGGSLGLNTGPVSVGLGV